MGEHLKAQLEGLRGLMSQAAQEVYDEWEQDEEGMDASLGAGGICDQISRAISGVIVENLMDVDVTEGGQDGDDHSWIFAYDDSSAYAVDIPPHLYERGGGYLWRKVHDVKFDVNSISIMPVSRSDVVYE